MINRFVTGLQTIPGVTQDIMKRSVDLQKLKPGTVVDSPVLALRWTHHGVSAREASLGARLANALVRRDLGLRSYPGQMAPSDQVKSPLVTTK